MQTVIKVPVTLRCGSSFVKKDIHGEEEEEEETNRSTVVRGRRLITSNVSAHDAQE